MPTSQPASIPADPPVAAIRGAAGAVAGDLGSFTWVDRGTEAPWLPGTGPVPVRTRTPIEVDLAPRTPVTAWVARAAKPGTLGDPVVSGTEGEGVPIAFDLALPPGRWELGVEMWFGDLGSAAYYWTLDVVG